MGNCRALQRSQSERQCGCARQVPASGWSARRRSTHLDDGAELVSEQRAQIRAPVSERGHQSHRHVPGHPECGCRPDLQHDRAQVADYVLTPMPLGLTIAAIARPATKPLTISMSTWASV